MLRRLIPALILLAAGLGAGMILGWYLRGQETTAAGGPLAAVMRPAPAAGPPGLRALAAAGRFDALATRVGNRLPDFVAALAELPPASQLAALDAFVARFGESFDSLMYRADVQGRSGACKAQLDALLAAAIAAGTSAQQRRLEETLSRATDGCARQLLAEKRFDEVDRMYERITLAMPELADYFLKLGRFRIRTGNFDGALAVLSQIENHGNLGAEARQLIRQVEASEAVTVPSGEDLPLLAHGSQFVVNAVIDGGSPVPLLIDTGAAMTVIDAGLLQQLGYSLDGRRAWFATAGGAVDAPVVSLRRLALGDAAIDELSVGALQVDIPGDVRGLLGMNFLRHFEFRIDQQNRTLHLDRRP